MNLSLSPERPWWTTGASCSTRPTSAIITTARRPSSNSPRNLTKISFLRVLRGPSARGGRQVLLPHALGPRRRSRPVQDGAGRVAGGRREGVRQEVPREDQERLERRPRQRGQLQGAPPRSA